MAAAVGHARSLSQEGSAAFESDAALTPQALPGYPNVYEYHAGQVSLISDERELAFPEGSHSALTTTGGALCPRTLKIPTTITSQNGAIIHRSTPIAITGCASHKTKHTKKTRKARKAERAGKKTGSVRNAAKTGAVGR